MLNTVFERNTKFDASENYDEDDDYYIGMSSVEEDVALPLLTIDDIFIHQHFIYGTQTRDGPPVPVCYKMNTKGNIGKIKHLIAHTSFDYNNPNKIRSVLGAFCSSNPLQFHKSDGSGYNLFIKSNKTSPYLQSFQPSSLIA